MGMQVYARVYQSIPEYARVCKSMQEYARVCQSMPMYARVCQSMPEYARVCLSMPIYANEEARTKAFQDLAARIPEFFQDFLSTFTCIACTGITDDLHPTYYGPFRYPLYPYF